VQFNPSLTPKPIPREEPHIHNEQIIEPRFGISLFQAYLKYKELIQQFPESIQMHLVRFFLYEFLLVLIFKEFFFKQNT
jgi:hypothetical protein